MITPRFTVTQDDESVYISIRCPYVRDGLLQLDDHSGSPAQLQVQDLDISVEGSTFKMVVAPYFLSLDFPGLLVQDGREKAAYDYDQGLLRVTVPKAERGKHFPDLDMPTKLMTRAGGRAGRPAIEVVSATTAEDQVATVNGEGETTIDVTEEIDWTFPQVLQEVRLDPKVRYGFNESHSGVFGDLRDHLADIIECPAPDHMSLAERRAARIEKEDSKWDEDHYMCDFASAHDIMASAKGFEPWWSTSGGKGAALSGEEQDVLLRLPRREHLATSVAREWLRVVDVVFAYAYDHRTTMGEPTVESSWTVTHLSCALSWLDSFTDISVLQAALYHRALAYPLHRLFELCELVWGDVAAILAYGRAGILKSLAAVRRMLDASESRYLLNTVVIDDLCVWLQTSAHDAHCISLYNEVCRLRVDKDDIRWGPLVMLETLVMEDAEDDYGNGGHHSEGAAGGEGE